MLDDKNFFNFRKNHHQSFPNNWIDSKREVEKSGRAESIWRDNV